MPSVPWLRAFPVLFVDDEPDNLTVLDATFSERFDVLTAPDAAVALKLLVEHPIAVLITDQRMPGMSGIALCGEVRRRWPLIYRIVVTAWGDRTATLAAINEGGVHKFLDKPWQVETLDSVISEALAAAALRQRESQLRTALLERERLLAMDAIRRRIAHDLGSACTVAQLSFDALSAHLSHIAPQLPTADQQLSAQTIGTLAQSLDMVADLQVELRKSQSRLKRKPESVTMADQLALIARMVPPAERGRVRVQAPPQTQAWVDPLHLSRILINLVYNALRMLRGLHQNEGRVHLTCWQGDHGCVHVSVEDDGPGISLALRDRIFEAGFSTRSDGDGLGLAIARELARSEGGSLTLATPQNHGGAHFLLTLPSHEGGCTAGEPS